MTVYCRRMNTTTFHCILNTVHLCVVLENIDYHVLESVMNLSSAWCVGSFSLLYIASMLFVDTGGRVGESRVLQAPIVHQENVGAQVCLSFLYVCP